MQTLIASIIVFGLIIFVHEFGHYIFAKATGIRVEEFALGMGPKVISKKWGETVYSIRALPLGGFCKMSGEQGHDDYQPYQGYDSRRFDQKPVLVRMGVVVAGPVMNFLLAALLFSMVFGFLGLPEDFTTVIGEVKAGSPAEEVGLLAGDRIIRINEEPIDSWHNMVNIIHNSAGKELKLTILRDKNELNVKVIPLLDPESKTGLIGVTPRDYKWHKIGMLAGVKEGVSRTVQFTVMTIMGLVELALGKGAAGDIAGPVGIITIIGESARFGLVYLVNLTAIISINLGLLNLLPIPALDGSRLLFLLFEAVRGRPVNPSKESFIHLVGFMFLMALMLFITYKDILKLL